MKVRCYAHEVKANLLWSSFEKIQEDMRMVCNRMVARQEARHSQMIDVF